MSDVAASDLSVGERIAVLRRRARLSQQVLADVLGTSRPVISCIENGSRHLTLANAIKVATFFDVSLDALVGLDSNGYEDGAYDRGYAQCRRDVAAALSLSLNASSDPSPAPAEETREQQ